MISIRKADDRGLTDLGWLFSRHTFSFGHYHDPQFLGFGSLVVINEDKVQPAKGFGTHSHRDMEIISYVLSGALEHKDSIGTGSVIHPGDVQRMSAGTGISHSEFNASDRDVVHFLQIWVLPEQKNLPPSYEQKSFSAAEKRGRLKLVGSRDGRDGSVTIHQDVNLFASLLEPGDGVSYQLQDDRMAWLQVARGQVTLNGHYSLAAGDGVAITEENKIEVVGTQSSEFLLFDLVRP
ncbi:MAG: pirin family protein [Pseudanabaenaceae cyanobacterium SKYGB_i_bin29]|nr:pirin family protein [Pseudanabaenaceae cyanobacterium SKYG29]MDW8422481.1 pirin family protein [Pseudanabaenaceae cyanobacterium SKYGB_i_bin29]